MRGKSCLTLALIEDLHKGIFYCLFSYQKERRKIAYRMLLQGLRSCPPCRNPPSTYKCLLVLFGCLSPLPEREKKQKKKKITSPNDRDKDGKPGVWQYTEHSKEIVRVLLTVAQAPAGPFLVATSIL